MSFFSPKGRLGRVQRGIHRAFVASNGKPLSTSEIMAYSHVRRLFQGDNSPRHRHNHCRAIRIAAEVLCVRVGRAGGTGRPIQWVLTDMASSPTDDGSMT